MKCKYCEESDCIKKGIRKGKQRYYCKNCGQSFQEYYSYNAYNYSVNSMIARLLKESCGVRSISRIIRISKNTVLSRMLKISHQIPIPTFNHKNASYEMDELWSYIGSKKNVYWITYAIEKESRAVIDFFAGNKSKENIKPLIDKILKYLPKRIYTDKLNIYPSLIPKALHRNFQYCTNRIERKNLTLRTHIKRLSRKTICYSKSEKFLYAHLKIYFWG